MRGFLVLRFCAAGLDHPRWLYVLPNDDVLVAETNTPAKPEDGKGLKSWLMRQVIRRAGAGTSSADRITLLRDADGDGQASDHGSMQVPNPLASIARVAGCAG